MIIEVSNLVKRYKNVTALNHFSLKVEEGEIFGLLGPNGSGKSTAINCMLSLLSYEKGEIRLLGEPMSPDNYRVKEQIGVVMQEVAVFNELTVLENIDYFCSLYIKDAARRNACVREAIDFTGLKGFEAFRPRTLSGGLLRRLNIACGIAHKPKLIFLDEPTVAVDPQSRQSILDGIRRLNREGATIVYTSHYMEEVEELCTRVMIMDKGQSVAQGTKEELKAMIRSGEKLTVEVYHLSGEALSFLEKLPGVLSLSYQEPTLTIRCGVNSHTLLSLLDYLRKIELPFGRVFSEPPTLNDVFLAITGKELRD